MYKQVIIARSLAQCRYFCTRNNLKREETLYAYRPEIMLGISNVKVIFLQGWLDREYARQIFNLVKQVEKGYGNTIFVMNESASLADQEPTMLLPSPFLMDRYGN